MNISGSVAACGLRKVFSLQDTFTDVDGTAVTAHTMDLGPGWAAIRNDFTITGNKAFSTDSTTNCVLRVNKRLTDNFSVYIEFAVEYVDDYNAVTDIGVIIKADDASSNGVSVVYDRKNHKVYLKKGAYTDTQWTIDETFISGLPWWSDNTLLSLKVDVSGNSVKATLTHTNTGTEYIGTVTIPIAYQNYPNYAGIIHHGDGVYTEHGMDNFEVWELK